MIFMLVLIIVFLLFISFSFSAEMGRRKKFDQEVLKKMDELLQLLRKE